MTRFLLSIALASGFFVPSSFAAESIEVCGRRGGVEVDKTFLDCSGVLKNIHQLEALKRFDKLERLVIDNSSRKVLNDEGMAYLKPLSNTLTELSIADQNVTAAGLKHLEGFGKLKKLVAYRTQIDDAGLASVAKLSSLKELALSGSPIDGSGLKSLSGLKNLQTLRLNGTDVGDDDLKGLAGIPNLRVIQVEKTKVTEAGVNWLQKTWPNASISH